LAFDADVPEEELRRAFYGSGTSALAAAQSVETIDSSVAPDLLHFLLLCVAGYWAALPQVARMITGADVDDLRRRAAVVEAARRLVSIGEDSKNLGDGTLVPDAGVLTERTEERP
jgi:hypothetical protein